MWIKINTENPPEFIGDNGEPMYSSQQLNHALDKLRLAEQGGRRRKSRKSRRSRRRTRRYN